ncbi:MAG: GNAT family N-acetyltransferase [Chloroflexota bacterium]
MVDFREATPDELEAWDDLTVHVGGGHVYQSRAWAEHRTASGWRPTFLMGSDGSAVLALCRAWPLIGGAGAYLPRGPVPAGSAEAMAARLRGAATWLAAHGADVVASDAEVPGDPGYAELLSAAGFHPIPEIQPSRHRMSLPLAGFDEAAIRAGLTKSARQRIAAAERDGLAVIRHDRGGDPAGDLFRAPVADPGIAFEAFSRLLISTGERVGFRIGDRAAFVDWWTRAHAAGHLILLEAVADAPAGAAAAGGAAPPSGSGTGGVAATDAAQIAGLVLYRHGGRLTTVHSADDPRARRDHPGLMHLLRWRAIQLALREGRSEMDLGGVDVAPDHAEPAPGSPTHGLYEHKRSFGARWVTMSGAHERIVRSWRYQAGRVTSRLVRMAGR